MTKWIVGLLVLANLLLFVWMRWGINMVMDTDTEQAALNPDKIKLVDSLPVSSVPPTPTSTGGMTLTLSPVSSVAVSNQSLLPISSTIASLPHQTIQLAAASATVNAMRCAEWGEFSGEDLSRAQQSLAIFKLGDNLTERVVEQNHGYWVYIPPQPRRIDVERKISQLNERGVKDLFVVKERGPWLNAISLGVFRNKIAAERYVSFLRTKDVHSAKVGERLSKLRFTLFDIKDLDSGITDKLKALQKEFPDSDLKLSACGN